MGRASDVRPCQPPAGWQGMQPRWLGPGEGAPLGVLRSVMLPKPLPWLARSCPSVVLLCTTMHAARCCALQVSHMVRAPRSGGVLQVGLWAGATVCVTRLGVVSSVMSPRLVPWLARSCPSALLLCTTMHTARCCAAYAHPRACTPRRVMWCSVMAVQGQGPRCKVLQACCVLRFARRSPRFPLLCCQPAKGGTGTPLDQSILAGCQRRSFIGFASAVVRPMRSDSTVLCGVCARLRARRQPRTDASLPEWAGLYGPPG